jgi:hypothetical protein
MRYLLSFWLGLICVTGLVVADDKDPSTKPNPDVVTGSVAEDTRDKDAPTSGVIVTKGGFDRLIERWGIEKPLKVDFEKQFVVVGTTRGGEIKLSTELKDGNLTVTAIKSLDLRPGFRYVMKRIDRSGVITVNGKPLPTE